MALPLGDPAGRSHLGVEHLDVERRRQGVELLGVELLDAEPLPFHRPDAACPDWRRTGCYPGVVHADVEAQLSGRAWVPGAGCWVEERHHRALLLAQKVLPSALRRQDPL